MENTCKKYSLISSVALILTAAIWGFSFVIVKDSLDYIGAFWIIAIRFTLGGIIISLFCLKKLNEINPSIIVHGIFLGLLFFCAYITQTVGCIYTTAGKNAFLTTLYVVLVPLFAWPVLHVKPRWYVFAAAVMSIAGIGLLSLNNSDGSVLSMNKGDILTLVCGVFFAFHIIFGARYVARENPLILTAIQFLTAGLLAFAAAPFLDEKPLQLEILFSPKLTGAILYLTLFASIFAFCSQNIALKYVPSALASLFMSLESVFGVFFSVIFMNEQLTPRMWTGCGLIFASIIIAEVLPETGKKTPSCTN